MNEEKRLRILESKKRYREKNAKPKTALTQRVHDWFQCSCCLAKIGFGSKKASKIIGVISYGTIGGKWLELGVKRYRPPSGNWKQAISPTLSALKPKVEKPKIKKICAQKEYEAACMSDIRLASKFPDWSNFWRVDQQKRKSRDYYHSLNDDEKKVRNRKLMSLRNEKYKVNPDLKKASRVRIDRWKKANPDKVRLSVKKCIAKRKIIDPGFRVQCNLRNRLKELMGTARKGGSDSVSSLIGCSTRQLAAHLERCFTKRMSWQNYGSYWHVDHIIPCAAFDQIESKQRAQCWHYTNLRPLEAKKNMEKSDTITEPQMSLLLCATH